MLSSPSLSRASSNKTMTLVDSAAATTCSTCRQRINLPRPSVVTNIFHSPNSLFRPKARGCICDCNAKSSVSLPKEQQQHQPQQTHTSLGSQSTPSSPIQVDLLGVNDTGVEVALKVDSDLASPATGSSSRGAARLPQAAKPIAGSSTVQLPPDDPPFPGEAEAGIQWQRPGNFLSPVRVRSHHYRQNKTKQPSPCDLYQCVAVDFVKSSHRLCHMASRVQLPNPTFDDDDNADDGAGPSITNRWHAPDVFVITLSIPAKAGKNKHGTGGGHHHHRSHPASPTGAAHDVSADEGEGYTVSMYFTMTPETRSILRRVTSPHYHSNRNHDTHNNNDSSSVNAVKLFDEWCRKSPTDPKFQGRFKLIPHIHNLKEVGLPQWMAVYNAKPLLIKRSGKTGLLYQPTSQQRQQHPSQSPTVNYLEFEVNFHPFPFLARQALQHLIEHSFEKLDVTMAFCIEGRTEDELPECILGQAHFCHPQVRNCVHAESFFS